MSLYKLAAAAARRWPSSVALVSQSEALTLSFEELERRAAAAAGVISRRGLAPGSVLVSDLKNSSSNLVTQLACSKLGVAYFRRADTPQTGRDAAAATWIFRGDVAAAADNPCEGRGVAARASGRSL